MTEEAPLNYSLMSPVPLPKTLLLVNNFIVNTTKFLNRFSGECELKLADVSKKITTTQTALLMLEAKLRSVPGIENFDPSAAAAVGAEPAPVSTAAPPPGPGGGGGGAADGGGGGGDPSAAAAAPSSSSTAVVPAGGEAGAEEASTALVVADAPPSNMRKACEHPRFRKYFKMLGMRIPLPACQQKMSVDLPDEDVGILERPDEWVELLPGEENEE